MVDNNLNIKATADDVEDLFNTILGRAINNDEFKHDNDGKYTIGYWVDRLVNSEEFKTRFTKLNSMKAESPNFIKDADYLSPSLDHKALPSKIILIGSCMLETWQEVLQNKLSNIEIDRKLFNNASELEEITEDEASATQFQILQIPLRSIIGEKELFGFENTEDGKAKSNEVFKRCLERIKLNLSRGLEYNIKHGITTFVLNFAVPQCNNVGFLLPKYDLLDFSYFVSELNRHLYQMVQSYDKVYFLDYNEITSIIGKRYVQDDITSHSNHGSYIGWLKTEDDIELTPHGDVFSIYDSKQEEIILAAYNEAVSLYNIINNTNKVKIVIFDLDGTLWRGVAADHEFIGAHLTEGWPLSILEVCSVLKRRGILLAIASKNDYDVAKKIWDKLYGLTFPFDNFVVKKISWKSKVNSVGEILKEVNLLSENCLLVDDNPIERERIKQAYPDIKILDEPICKWRRILLWSSELQVPAITKESANRSNSIKAIIERENMRQNFDEQDFINELKVEVEFSYITNSSDKKFKRAFELLNKTNQFNTTGHRYT